MTMLSLHSGLARLCDGLTRREALRVGGLSAFGLSLPGVLAARQTTGPSAATGPKGFARARACIVLWMTGGPSQLESWDPKPGAPTEVRGPFGTLPTRVPGLRVGELMPRTAALAHELCVVRSVVTNDPSHVTGGYTMLTGMEHPRGKGNDTVVASRTDFPYFGSVVKRFRRPMPGIPTTVVFPQHVFNLNWYAGQDAGLLGSHWDPWHVLSDPAAPGFQVADLSLQTEVPALRLAGRRGLLAGVGKQFERLQAGSAPARFSHQVTHAFDLLASRKVRDAFDLNREPSAVRDRYGQHTFGQGCLLARRLVEAGVVLVQVNWHREQNDDTPMWDSHWNLETNLKSKLMPPMDLGYSALFEDLRERGLLAETLVVWVGEMGRTPKLEYVKPHPAPGRNHWGGVFSMALAGAGIRGGLVYGASDKQAAYPTENPVSPQDLTATLFHALGLPPETEIRDRLNRPLPISRGRVLQALF
jgi:hypothetical protein